MNENSLYKGKILYKIKQMFRLSEELTSIFGHADNTSLKINGHEFPLKTIGGWKAEQDGVFVIDFLLDTKIINAMTKSQEMYFEAWFGHANRDVDPSVEFSTEGLQRAIAALSRQAQ